ncbi:MAG: DNA polymerase III subunit gamma/tau [Planctomycetota bacterium]|jgi:DNA polymerase-3 subunit gamma/tau
MSYLVLARKYRPHRFEDMVGQEVVTSVLRGAIDEGRVGHAYLFAGPRGTGKTTTARILAKALNCVNGPTADPCGECERCVASDEGTELDVIEIDAASNTSVNDVRELRESVGYAPVDARFKVYIVDEVHMLSRAAFNALLKTLEEPPSHVKFLFATTELHKVPDTILSRCQVMRLSPIRDDAIVERLEQVFAAEGIDAEDGIAAELARRARGGMRDALSLSDQLLALAGNAPKLADLSRLAGGAGLDELLGLVDAILGQDRAAIIETVGRWNGRESELASALLDTLRACLVAAVCGVGSPYLDGGERAAQAYLERAKAIGSERLELMLGDLLRARERMGWLPAQLPRRAPHRLRPRPSVQRLLRRRPERRRPKHAEIGRRPHTVLLTPAPPTAGRRGRTRPHRRRLRTPRRSGIRCSPCSSRVRPRWSRSCGEQARSSARRGARACGCASSSPPTWRWSPTSATDG